MGGNSAGFPCGQVAPWPSCRLDPWLGNYTPHPRLRVHMPPLNQESVQPGKCINKSKRGLPWRSSAENPPANAGDTDLTPGPGRGHVRRGHGPRGAQLLPPARPGACAPGREPAAGRSPRTAPGGRAPLRSWRAPSCGRKEPVPHNKDPARAISSLTPRFFLREVQSLLLLLLLLSCLSRVRLCATP